MTETNLTNEQYADLVMIPKMRKICEWSEANPVDFDELSEDTQQLILELPQRDLKGIGTFDDIFTEKDQFILGHIDNKKYYLIDTQGYKYSRYVCRLIGIRYV